MIVTAMVATAAMSGVPSTPPMPPAPPAHHHVINRSVVESAAKRLRGPLDGLGFYLKLDEGRVMVNVDTDSEVAYIDAHWPHNGNAMLFALHRVKCYGYRPIPEEDSPAEIMPNGAVRIYLEEL